MQQSARADSRVFTIPNLLSFFRLLLVPVFLGLIATGHGMLALLTLVVSSVSDFLDGYLARRLDQVSRLGKILDPTADRLYIFATLIGLALWSALPWWFVIGVAARDVMIVVIGLVLARHRFGPLPVHHLGKVATFCLLLALPVLLLAEAVPATGAVALPIGWAVAIWGLFLYWWAGAIYIREAARAIRALTSQAGD